MSDGLFDMPKRAYRVQVVEAWTLEYWVMATDPDDAVTVASHYPGRRFRHMTQREAFEVTGVQLFAEGTDREGEMPAWVPTRPDWNMVIDDERKDHPVPDKYPTLGVHPRDHKDRKTS